MELHEELARQARELWNHLPGDLRPGLDDPVAFRTDSTGNLMVAYGDAIFGLREGVAWSWRPRADGGPDLAGWCDGRLIGTTTTPPGVGLGEARLN